MSVSTTTSTLTALMKTYYDKLMLEVATPIMVADQFADHSRDIPQHEGQTVAFQRYVPLAKITAVTAEGSNPDYVELEAVRFEETIAKYSNSIQTTDTLELTAFDLTTEVKVRQISENMGESLNYQYRKVMARGFYPLRVDNSATYGVSGTITSGATTTVFVDTSLTQADHFWVDGTVVFTSGQNKGISVHVTAFGASADQVTFTPALKEACDTGDTYRIVTSTGLGASNVVTCASVERAVAILKHYRAPKYDGKNYIGIISPFVDYDFRQDSGWVNAHEYAGSEALFNGEIGKWGGVRWVEDTDPWTETVADGTVYNANDVGFGAYSATGAVNHTPIFGRNAYAGVHLEGVPDKLIIKVSGPQDTSNPTNAYSYVSWKAYFVATILNATWGVTLLTGATTVA